MAQTLDQLVLAVARRYGGAESGTATGGTTSTLTDASARWEPDNTWNNKFVRITSGANAGQERLVLASTQSTRTLSLDPALASVVANGDTYQLLPRRRNDFVEAINEAITRAGDTWLSVEIKDDIAFSARTQEYGLPSDLVGVLAVWIGMADAWQPQTSFEVLGNAGAYKLHLRSIYTPNPQLTNVSQVFVRIQYTSLPALLANPADTLTLGDAYERDAVGYIVEYALGLLNQRAFSENKTGEASRAFLTASERHFQEAELIRSRARPQPVMERNRTRRVPAHI